MMDRFPRLRKLTINTTGLTPHRAIPMLTQVVKDANERGIIFSTRVSIDGVGDMHNAVRNVKKRLRQGQRDDHGDEGAPEGVPLQLRDLDDDLLAEPRRRREHPAVGASARTSTSCSTWCG